ncbi:hypothetical protein BP6252_12768 [Coleophoma cylindrospora]|uniref:Homeobox domain-containing protein n=1 Tax=Coleophoma cylindrospora TaxID=1849047 RepID=A0A3D8QD93_9HELO|nr:hypothetical protein BP6252_12768 [Coleophoma cylindrospora]
MRAPSMLPSAREMLWEDRRPVDLPSRPRSQAERIELPSIRQAVPELQLLVGHNTSESRTESRTYSPTSGPASISTPTEYVPSPSLNKRRRLSSDEDREAESREFPASKLQRSPSTHLQRPQSGGASSSSGRHVSESWAGSNRSSPYLPAGGLPSMRSPPPFEATNTSRQEWRPTLPSLPSLTLERPSQQPALRSRNTWGEYSLDTSRSGAQTYPQGGPSFSPPQPFHQQPFSYSSYQQPRNQAYGSSHALPLSHDRTPFSSHGQHAQNMHNQHEGYMSGYGDMGVAGDSKTRKRRGNLPKETTDKLRAWFVAHLQHPYPTEDEKQELMRMTGLQMNQISNWFINARRRQLPTMINNARAESDARSARSGDSATQSVGRTSVPLSDSEGEYDDEFKSRVSAEKGENRSV